MRGGRKASFSFSLCYPELEMYTTAVNAANRLQIELSPEQTAYFNDVMDKAIDEYIDGETRTTFGGTEVTTVYVDGSCTNMLVIPTMHDITQIQKLARDDSVEETLDTSDYLLYPSGDPDTYAIRLRSGIFTEGFENYAITGVLGHRDVPEDIMMVATELAANGINQNISNIKRERVGDWDVIYKDADTELSLDSTSTLARYKRLSRSI